MSEEKIPLTFSDHSTPSSTTRIYRKNTRAKARLFYLLIAVCLIISIIVGGSVGLWIGLDNKSSTKLLYESVRVENAMDTLQLLQKIADQYDPPSRSILTGYNKSAEMITEQLESSGYNVSLQYFEVPVYSNLAEGQAVFTATFSSIDFTWIFLEGPEFAVMRYSGSSSSSEPDRLLQLVNGSACNEQNFENFTGGAVALLDYSDTECSVYDKASNAANVGASGVVMMRDQASAELGPPASRIYGDEPEDTVNIPVLGVTYQLGEKLLELINLSQFSLEVHIETTTSITMATTYNVLASTSSGKDDSIIIMGSHLDSVPAGPGINDNGSGSAANLEIALALSRLGIEPKNKIIFAFWGAEEIGLRGSRYFVNSLSEAERDDIVLNLNFDMIASPNYVRGVYNGSGADEIIRSQCEVIQEVFEDRFNQKELPYSIFPFTGRSDYGPFIDPAIAIPAGAVATGSNTIKDEEERRIYGGFANVQLDTCYHLACDTIDNIDQSVFAEMMDNIAYTLQILMMQNDLKGYLNNNSTTHV